MRSLRRIAFLEGRWAAPFNGFICGTEQDPHYAVWGRFGNPAPEWGHGQPEKCRALLDVLMPGDIGHIAKAYKSDGSLLDTLGQPDGITRGELQRTAKNVLTLALRLDK